MPKLIKEISSGQSFTRSTADGKLADAQVRTFRILLNQPGELVNIQQACNIKPGDPHPVNTNVYCVSWEARFDGDSRAVIIATFNYQSTASSQGQDQNDQPPDIRPANWTTSTSLMEVPAQSWVEVGQNNQAAGVAGAPINPAGDRYDGVATFDALVTISIEQYCVDDPTEHCLYAGSVNQEQITVGSLVCQPGSIMFRGVQAKPTVEAYGDLIYRGWTGTYEFAYRPNFVKGIWWNNATYDGNIGWDTAVPQTGFNVKCFLNAGNVDVAGMPLKHKSGKIDGWPNAVALPDGVNAGDKARAMVLVYEYENGGASQLPSAQPIPLSSDGSPRINTANPPVIVRRYRTAREVNFTNTFGLRLQ